MQARILWKPAIVFVCAGAALAETNIHVANKYAWSENVGWTNWRDANGGAQGVVIGPNFLSGFIWAENIGWINVGDGDPGALGGSEIAYANVDGADIGVNVLSGGLLSGFAWGENVGWINFDGGALATPPQHARLVCNSRFSGYAWGENIGWINLGSMEPGKFVAIAGFADCNANGISDECETPPSGLTHYWPFQDSVRDLVGTAHGALTGGAGFVVGKRGLGLHLGAGTIDDSAGLGSGAGNFGTGPFTVQFWVRTTQAASVGLLSNRIGCSTANVFFELDMDSSGNVTVQMGDGINSAVASSSTTYINDGVFHFLSVTREGPTVRLYVDGVESASSSSAGVINLFSPSTGPRVGQSGCYFPPSGGFIPLKGDVDELQFFNRALGADEIAQIHASGGTALDCDGDAMPDACQIAAGSDDCNSNGILDSCEPPEAFVGHALDFAGSDDYLRVPHFGLVMPTTEITVEFWVRADEDDSDNAVTMGLDKNPLPETLGSKLFVWAPYQDGLVYWQFGETYMGYTPPQPIIGTWQHYSMVASQSGAHNAGAAYMRIYRNGVQEAQQPGMSPFVQSDRIFNIGTWYQDGFLTYDFNGAIDEVRIWSVARSPAEVLANYNHRLPPEPQPGLVAYWRFDEGQGGTTADWAGGAMATRVGGAAWIERDSCAPPCPGHTGDMNADTFANGRDIQRFSLAVITSSTAASDVCSGDFNNSGVVDPPDIALFVSAMLAAP